MRRALSFREQEVCHYKRYNDFENYTSSHADCCWKGSTSSCCSSSCRTPCSVAHSQQEHELFKRAKCCYSASKMLTTTLCACVAPHDKLLLHHHCRCATPSAQRQLALVTTLVTLMMTLLTDLVKRSVRQRIQCSEYSI
jgi:hypothetical protein